MISEQPPTQVKTGDDKMRAGAPSLIRILRHWGTIIVIALVAIGFSVASPYFATLSNLDNILFSMIVSTLVALGLTFVVVAGSFDLSVGLIVTTTSIVMALSIEVIGPWLSILLSLAVGCLVGLVNGLLVTYGRLSGIVVTLGMMFVLTGINMVLSNGYQIAIPYDETAFLFLGQGRVGPIAMPVIIMLLVFLAAHFFATSSKPGHYIAAVGDNAMAAYYSGVRVYDWVIVAFILSGLLSAVGGVLLASMSTSAQPVGGEGYLLEGFAAVYLGGTILGKGHPHVLGTLLGIFFLYMVSTGMSMVGFSFSARQLFNGLVLILAVGANALLNREELHMKFT
jgi:ribose/xylose/arabinose/galactoside ABC-type transport system permease subunit